MRRLRVFQLIVVGATLLSNAAAFGHANAPDAGWNVEPLAFVLLLLTSAIYLFGRRRMNETQRRLIAPPRRVAAYWSAVLVLVLALFSPIDTRSESSFTWHMFQHLLLMLGAAPLLAVSNLHLVALFILPMAPRRRTGQLINATPGVKTLASNRVAPLISAILFTLGLWLWHAPRLYVEALANEQLHTLEHLTFLMTAALFWRMIATSGDRRLDAGTSIVLVTLVGLQGNLLAALITLAPTPLYAGYGMFDQQLAGLLMWVPAGAIYLAATLFAIARLTRQQPFGGKARVPT